MKYIIDALRSVKSKLNSMDMRKKRAYRSDYNTKATEQVNSKALKSDTEYLIYVELNKFRTNIFKKNGNRWSLVKSYKCSIGKPSTPTIKGIFKVGIKGPYFGVEHGYKCYYYTQIKGNYLFHSIIYNLNGTVRDGRLGMRISDGCVRLAKENAKWIYDNVPKGSTIYIE
ncbi:L,D-transpeptidase [Clostridium sp. UBA7503]|uniref:L,D-transpeptidase n=1 Tax=Clostridium sp. UBA7503 TaxID=1946377 RepID=UPI0039C87D78